MSTETLKQLTRNYNKTELAQEVFKLRGAVKRDESADPNIREAGERAGQEALANVTSLSPEDMAANMTSLGVSVNNTLQQVTSEIIQGRNTLADLEKACTTKTGELENLFGQEVIARSIGNALADHDAKKKEFAAKEAEVAEDLSRAEASAAQRQSEWTTQFNKDCERARTEFDYTFTKQKREQKDAFATQLKTERMTFDDDQRIKDREAAEAEADLQKRQLAVVEQEAQAEALEATLKAKFDKEKHTVTGAMEREHKHATAIALTNSNTAAQIAASTITTQGDQIDKQQAEIEALKHSLVEAQGKNNDLAKQALESASGRFALDSVMAHSDGQGTTRSTRGKAS